jgi:hypothetical protein
MLSWSLYFVVTSIWRDTCKNYSNREREREIERERGREKPREKERASLGNPRVVDTNLG